MKDYSIGIFVRDQNGTPLPLVELTSINIVTGLASSRFSSGDGGMNHALPGHVGDLLTFTTNGYVFTASDQAPQEGPMYYKLTDNVAPVLNLTAKRSFNRPRTLEQLARVRGAMWTQRLNLPMGPRPGQDSNINA